MSATIPMIRPPPPLPSTWRSLPSTQQYLRPSAHFRAHHPAFKSVHGFSHAPVDPLVFSVKDSENYKVCKPRDNFIELDVAALRYDLANDEAYNGGGVDHDDHVPDMNKVRDDYIELDVAALRYDLANDEGYNQTELQADEEEGEWCEELVMTEEWAQHFISKQSKSVKRTIRHIEERSHLSILQEEEEEVNTSSTKTSKNKKNKNGSAKKAKKKSQSKLIASYPIVKPWRKLRYSSDRLSEVRQLEADIKGLTIKHGRNWPVYPECEIRNAADKS